MGGLVFGGVVLELRIAKPQAAHFGRRRGNWEGGGGLFFVSAEEGDGGEGGDACPECGGDGDGVDGGDVEVFG